MKIGCQVGLWGRSLKKAMSDISAAGLEGIETFGLEEYYDNPQKLRVLLDEFGITLSGIYHHPEIPEVHSRGRAAYHTLEKATAAIKFLKAVKGEFLILQSGSIRKPEVYPISVYDRLTDTINEIGKVAREYGIKVALHPHADTMGENREELTIFMERLDANLVGLCPHASHWLAVGADPYEISQTYADRVSYVHVTDQGPDGKSVNIGEGGIDQQALMKPLQAVGFDGWVIIENKHFDLPVKESIKISAEYLKKRFIKK